MNKEILLHSDLNFTPKIDNRAKTKNWNGPVTFIPSAVAGFALASSVRFSLLITTIGSKCISSANAGLEKITRSGCKSFNKVE